MKSKIKFSCLPIILIIVMCFAFAGCGKADYEAIYNDDVKIAHGSSNVRTASVQSSLNGKYTFSCGSLSGVYVMINSFTVDGNTSASLSYELKSGKGKVVLVNGDSVYTLTEESYNGALGFDNIPDGKYRLKMVGVEAEFSLILNY